MSKNCLLVIDMLNDFLDRWEDNERNCLIENTNELIRSFREAECHVIWVRQEFKADLSDAFIEMQDRNIAITIEGTHGSQIHKNLERDPSDIVFVKKRYSAFFRTPLQDILNEREITTITIAGVNTHACIRMAAIDAYQRDMRVLIASDCVDSLDKEHANVTLHYLDGKIATVKSNQDIISSLI